MVSNSRSRASRVSMALAGVAVLGLATTGSVGAIARAAVGDGTVDLSIESTNSSIAPGQSGTQSFTVTNNGSVATSSELTLKVVTPFFVNSAPDQLPDGCKMLLANPDRDIPQIVDCRIQPGLPPGGQHTVKLPMVLDKNAPAVFLIGRAIVTPAPGTPDAEASIADNITPYGVQVIGTATGATDDQDKPNAYVAYDAPFLAPGEDRATTLRAGNRGAPSKGALRLVYLTPFYVNLTEQIPAGCERLLANDDPTVPQVLSCAIPPGLGKAETLFQVPLTMVAGGPVGWSPGAVIVSRLPDNQTDIDTDLRDNFVETAIVAG